MPDVLPIKRVVGDRVTVEADAFADGHDHVVVLLLHRKQGAERWTETPMESIFNDRYRASFTVDELGRYQYTIQAWVDRFHTWRYDLTKRAAAGQDLAVDLLIGAAIVGRPPRLGPRERDGKRLRYVAEQLRSKTDQKQLVEVALDQELIVLMDRHADRSVSSIHTPAYGNHRRPAASAIEHVVRIVSAVV